MNNILKNIFGMHIGCTIEYCNKRYKLGCVDNDSGDEHYTISPTNRKSYTQSCLEYNRCKLILKNLKSISKEDMMEVTDGFFTIGIKPIELIATNGIIKIYKK